MLTNDFPKPIIKSISILKDKFISLFKTNTPKQNVYGRGQKLSKDRIIRDICKIFEIDEEKEEVKKNKNIMKD